MTTWFKQNRKASWYFLLGKDINFWWLFMEASLKYTFRLRSKKKKFYKTLISSLTSSMTLYMGERISYKHTCYSTLYYDQNISLSSIRPFETDHFVWIRRNNKMSAIVVALTFLKLIKQTWYRNSEFPVYNRYPPTLIGLQNECLSHYSLDKLSTLENQELQPLWCHSHQIENCNICRGLRE